MRKVLLLSGLFFLIILSVSSTSFSQAPAALSSTYRGDIDEDSQVNIFDLLEMLKMLSDPAGQTERARRTADMDGSGSVNIFDLLGLLNVLSGAEKPGIIYWESAIDSLSQKIVDPGDTLTIYVENFDDTITADSVKAYIDDREMDLLEFNLESIMIIIPKWFDSGQLRLMVGTDTTNSIYIVKTAGIPNIMMVSIPADSFQMGSFSVEINERPVHTVALDAFQISETEITNAQYAAYLNVALALGEITVTTDSVIGVSGDYSGQTYLELSKGFFVGSTAVDTTNRCWITHDGTSFIVEPDRENWPVVFVTWYGASAFAKHYGISLPTEAEWESASRGGKQYMYGTDDGTINNERANYNKYVNSPNDVGAYAPNPFDLSNMSGNVREWCNDWYDPNYYSSSPSRNPPGSEYGMERVARGGGWNTCDWACRSAKRIFFSPSYRSSYLGFRVVRR